MNNLIQPRNSVRRIGLFGGTFNPIHRGHVQVAEDVLRGYDLNHIYMIPCALPPHKSRGIVAPARDRVEMARLAVTDHRAITISQVEIDRPRPSYTIDTLKQFNEKHQKDTDLFFLVGMDAFLEIHTWKSYRQLFDQSAFIVMTRPEADGALRSLHPLALNYARHHISDGYRRVPAGDALVHAEKKTIYLAQVTPLDVTSTLIRARIRRGEPVSRWVPPAVSEYLDRKGLYR